MGWAFGLVSVRIDFKIVGPDEVHPQIPRVGPVHLVAHRKVAGLAFHGVLEAEVLVLVGRIEVESAHYRRVHHGPAGAPEHSDRGEVVGAGGVVGLQPEDVVTEAGRVVAAQVEALVRVQQQAGRVHARLGIPANPVVVHDLPAPRVGEEDRVLRLEDPRPVVAAVLAQPLRRVLPAVQIHLQPPGLGQRHPRLVVRRRAQLPRALIAMDGVVSGRLHRIQTRRPLRLIPLGHPRKPRPDRKRPLRPERVPGPQQQHRRQKPPAKTHGLLIPPQESGSTAVGRIDSLRGGWPL